MKKDVILLGIQWCGKWTQAELLLKILKKHKYLEMWNTLRALTSNDNLIWNYLKDRMTKWFLVDHEMTFGILDMCLHITKKSSWYLVIDWFPRCKEQMYFFLSRMMQENRDFVVVHYALTKKVALERIMKRAKLQWRKDDKPESIKKRLEIFQEETMPVINYLKSIWKVIEIDANDTVENIFKNTKKKLWL